MSFRYGVLIGTTSVVVLGDLPVPDGHVLYQSDTPLPDDYPRGWVWDDSVPPLPGNIREKTSQEQTDDAYTERLVELYALAREVSNQGVTVTLPSNGSHDCRSTEEAFRIYQAANTQDVLPGATQTADVDVWGRWYRWAIGDVPSIMVQLYLLYAGTNGNAEGHQDELERLRQADDEAGIRAYDITTGWPAPPTPPEGVEALDIGTTETVPLGALGYVIEWNRTRDEDRDVKRIMRFLRRVRDRISRARDLEDAWLRETGQG